jgi:hypothetical protein
MRVKIVMMEIVWRVTVVRRAVWPKALQSDIARSPHFVATAYAEWGSNARPLAGMAMLITVKLQRLSAPELPVTMAG